MTDAVLSNKFTRIGSISFLQTNEYLVQIQLGDNGIIESKCRVEEYPITRVNFESEDFNRLIMMGLIPVRNLCDVIVKFHRCEF